MLDQNYIDEIKQLDTKEAKEKLSAYAAGFNISVKKTRSVDNMIADIEAGLKALSNEPLPEQPLNGLTISDLIQADDELNGDSIFEEAKPEAIAALTGQTIVQEQQPVEITVVVRPEPVKVKIDTTISEENKTVSYELPADYYPRQQLLGKGNNAYITLPWWIYDWIIANENWKEIPNEVPHKHYLDTVLLLIYYIKKNGEVRIRETRNSGFFTLK